MGNSSQAPVTLIHIKVKTQEISFAEMERELDDEEKTLMMKKIFRRSSIIDSQTPEGTIKADMMGTIINSMGQSYDKDELNKWIARFDKEKTGRIGYDAYARICSHFVKDAAALIKSAQDKYSFKNLINLNDFENP